MAAKLANLKAGDNQHKAGPANLPDHSISQAQAAEMLNVSERSVRAAATCCAGCWTSLTAMVAPMPSPPLCSRTPKSAR